MLDRHDGMDGQTIVPFVVLLDAVVDSEKASTWHRSMKRRIPKENIVVAGRTFIVGPSTVFVRVRQSNYGSRESRLQQLAAGVRRLLFYWRIIKWVGYRGMIRFIHSHEELELKNA
jgi:hypothetical protein